MPGQIIQGTGAGATIGGVDDLYVVVQPPNSVQLPGAQTNIGAFVGSASWGPLNTAQTIGNGQDLINAFGPPGLGSFDLPTDILNALQSGCNNIKGVRVSDGLDLATIIKVTDNTGFATDTLTVGGVFAAGVALSVTITPVTGSAVTVNYTTVTADASLAGVATSLAATINASAAVTGPNAFLQTCTVAGAVITLKALASGTSQNAIGLTATGTGVTLTVGGATFTGGVAPGTLCTMTGKYTGSLLNGASVRLDNGSQFATLSPTYKLTIAPPSGAAPEIYDNIVAYSAVGGGYAAATFAANLANALNASPQLSSIRPASSYFIGAAGASTAAPLVGSVFAISTSGADGAAFASGATNAQLGNDAATPKTGMYALSGQIGGGQFGLSGNTDLTNASAAMIAFGQRENALAVMAFAKGTSTSSAVASKQTLGIASYSAVVLKDWVEFSDTVNNVIPRSISPVAFVVAKIATQSPETSPANQRLALITGTERTGSTQNQPYSPAELDQLESAGINLVTNSGPGGNMMMLRHNKNSLGKADPRGNIAYTQMVKFLVQSYASTIIGQFVGLAQSRQPNDPLRDKVRSAFDDFHQPLKEKGVIDSYSTQCDLRNNPVSQISAGVLRADMVVVFMAVVDRIIASFTGGQTAKIQVVPLGVTAQS